MEGENIKAALVIDPSSDGLNVQIMDLQTIEVLEPGLYIIRTHSSAFTQLQFGAGLPFTHEEIRKMIDLLYKKLSSP